MTRLREIEVRGCRVHNLRGIDVTIPHDKITVVTGVSGSGKSSLAFDTVFAEGRRRYLESLSAYARQFVEQIPRPDVDVVLGLPPTVSIDQRTTRGGARSTVASMAEVLDALRLLFARLGTRHCERCDTPVEGTSVERIVDEIRTLAKAARASQAHLLAPLVARRKGFHKDVFARMIGLGVTRARVDGVATGVEPVPELSRYHEHSIEALIATAPTSFAQRDVLERAVRDTLSRGGGALHVAFDDGLAATQLFSSVAACPQCGIGYGPLEPGDLSWTRKASRCPTCEGRGSLADDEDGGAEDRVCTACDGARLSRASRAIRFRGRGLHEFLAQSVSAARAELSGWTPANAREEAVLAPLAREVVTRLAFLEEVGLDYPHLGRGARTLSGGESQRVRLASQLGTGLRGVCYVLDEPTIGLHPADNARLLRTLRALCDRGATLLVVEHDEDTIRAADHVIDIGPGAGRHGGRVVAEGTPREIEANPESVTGPWLRNTVPGQFLRSSRATPGTSDAAAARSEELTRHRTPALEIYGARARNLKDIDVRFPIGALTCVTGVSGSGKSTLVRGVLRPALLAALDLVGPTPGDHDALFGAEHVSGVLEIDQSPIGKTSRSVPATYTGIMDPLRTLFAATPEARARGFTASRFSFNGRTGACPECKGQGRVRVEMNFLPDVAVPCDACDGRRYDEETLGVRFRGLDIAEVLALPVAEARRLFAAFPKMARVLDVLDEVGLGYLELGQSSSTLSGGEAQRVKLATEMAKRGRGSIVYLLDEPTTGLHMADVAKLLLVLRGLVEQGNTVIVIEHNLDVVAASDVIVDLGPRGGDDGGRVVAYGSPAEVAAAKGSVTGTWLARRGAAARA